MRTCHKCFYDEKTMFFCKICDIINQHIRSNNMKKLILFLSLAIITHFLFAIPNIKLYENGKILQWIENNKIYNDEGVILNIEQNGKLYSTDGQFVGTIKESNNRIVLDAAIDNNKVHQEYNKANGFLVLSKLNDAAIEYDEKTGLQNKCIIYKDNKIDSYWTYEYSSEKITKIFHFDSNGKNDETKLYYYHKKNGHLEKTESRSNDGKLKELIEYDTSTEHIKKSTAYNENGSIKEQVLYNNKEEPIEKLVYFPNSKKSEKWTFIIFNEKGEYPLSENIYLSTNFFSTTYEQDMENYIKSTASGTDEWNDNYNFIVRKHTFTKDDKDYKYIEELKNKRYLSSKPFTLCNKNSLFYYYFIPNNNDEIDYTKCYEIELIKRKKNYPALNKSGKNKGPFGFDIGMTYNEVKEACGGTEPEHISDDRYWVKPKKSHPQFEKYIVWISDSVGLYYVKGVSKEISTSEYGNEVKSEFENLVNTLEKKYGKFTKTNKIKPDYLWKDERYWTQSIRDGARTYTAQWTANDNNYKAYDGLFGIIVDIKSFSPQTALIYIEYMFINANAAQEALDDVL